MTYLIDTDWIVDYLRGRLPAIALLDQLTPDGIAVSAMTVGELYEGIFRNSDRNRRGAILARWLNSVEVIIVDRETARLFGVIRADLRSRGDDIGAADVVIAATALQHDLTLVTRNLDHFRRVPDLKIYGET